MKKAFILCVLLAFFLAGCGGQEEAQMEQAKGEAEEVTQAEETTEETGKPITQEPIERDKNPIVVMETNHGTIEIELFWKETPKIAENFLRLVISGYYDELTFHRIVPGFVIQGGDPLGTGTGGPGYTLPDEPTTKKHDRGGLAMARGGRATTGASSTSSCPRRGPLISTRRISPSSPRWLRGWTWWKRSLRLKETRKICPKRRL